MVLVTEDALVARGEVLLRDDGGGPGADSTQVLYFGDPAELPDAVAQQGLDRDPGAPDRPAT